MDLLRVTRLRQGTEGNPRPSPGPLLRLLAALAIQALMAFPTSSFAQSETGQLLFVGNGNIPPMIEMVDGHPQGLVVDLVLAMAARAGLEVSVLGMDWAEAQQKVLRGEADALVQINPTTGREAEFVFSRPLLESRFSIFRKDSRGDINRLDSLFGRTVGVEKGGYPAETLARYPQIKTRIIPDWKTGFELLKADGIDAVVVDRWVGEYELARTAIHGITIVDDPIEISQSAIAVRKGNDLLLAKINIGLGKIHADGTAARIRNRWRSREVVYVLREDVNIWTWVAISAVISFVLSALVIFYSMRLRRVNASLSREVADRRLAEQAQHESERRYMALASGTFEGVVLSDQGVIVDVNPQFAEFSGWSADQLVGHAIADFLPTDAAPAILANIRQGLESTVEHEMICADGSLRVVEAHGKPHVIGGKQLRLTAIRDITQRKVMEADLLHAKAEAERAALARSKFLAAASHDLRQPVQALTLLMAAIRYQETSPPVSKALTLMENALDGLSSLLTSILDVSRLDSGVVTPQFCNFHGGALLGRLASEYSLLADDRGLRIRVVARGVILHTDPALLERALRNLIENALRYTPAGGVLLGLRVRGNSARIEVVDSGIGIAANKLPHIFEEFYQVDNPGRDRTQGLGLGLAIVARLARLMGAQITVTSREGRGSRFALVVPLGTAASIPVAGEKIPTGTPSGRVLIIEDDASVRSGLALLVESWGHTAVVAATGEEALDLCPPGPIDIILADHRLGPGMSGTQAATRIRVRAGQDIPVAVITGETEPERIAEIHASGFTLLHKPVVPDELRRVIAQLLRDAMMATSA